MDIKTALPLIVVRFCWALLYAIIVLSSFDIIRFQNAFGEDIIADNIAMLALLFMLPYIYMAGQKERFNIIETPRSYVIGLIFHAATIAVLSYCVYFTYLNRSMKTGLITSWYIASVMLAISAASALIFYYKRRAIMKSTPYEPL